MSPPVFVVEWTNTGNTDLQSIIRYIAADNPLSAAKILGRIKKKAQSLTDFPSRGRVVPELQGIGIYSHREIIIKPWRIIYRIESQTVFVVSVLDSRRQLQDLLLERLIRS